MMKLLVNRSAVAMERINPVPKATETIRCSRKVTKGFKLEERVSPNEFVLLSVCPPLGTICWLPAELLFSLSKVNVAWQRLSTSGVISICLDKWMTVGGVSRKDVAHRDVAQGKYKRASLPWLRSCSDEAPVTTAGWAT